MKKYIILFVFAFMGNLLQGQDSENRALIYLKDGSTLRAVVLKQSPESVKVRLSGGAEVEFATAEILRIKDNSDRYVYNSDGSMSKQKGFYHGMNGQLTISGKSANEGTTDLVLGFGGQYSLGWQPCKYASVGGGIGVRYYDSFFGDAFVQARGFLPVGKVSPFLSAEAGYGTPISLRGNNNGWQTQKGGWSLRPSIGLRIATRRRADLLVEAGYQFQRTVTEENWGGNSGTTFDVWYQRLSFRFGWLF